MYKNNNKFKNSKAYQNQHKYVDEDENIKPIRHNNSTRDFSDEVEETNDKPIQEELSENAEPSNDEGAGENVKSSLPILPKINKKNPTKVVTKGLKKFKGIGLLLGKYKIIIVIVLIVIFIIILAILMSLNFFASAEEAGGGNNSGYGYYDSACNFNETTIDYTENTNTYTGLSLDEFVMGTTYSYIKDNNYSDEMIKALMIIIKTNTLSYGGYDNSSQRLSLNNFGKGYIQINENSSDYSRINELYSLVSEEIYVSDSYSGTISSFSESDSLIFDDTIITDMVNFQSTYNYDELLDKVYQGMSKAIYKISDNCTYYNITENDAYWWPIGSSNETGNNIYGGEPTVTKITSYFGPRVIEGASGNHGAIDIGATCQDNIVIATKSGTVQKVSNGCNNNGYYGNKCGGGFGNYVTIDHGDGLIAYYAHLYPDSITVNVGDSVKQGQKLGLVGNSGSSTGCHLHFELRLNGTKVDPLDYISTENPRPISQYSLVAVEPKDNTQAEVKNAICKSLSRSGFSNNAIAGMMVNIESEGSFILNNLEGCYEENNCCFNGTYGFCKHPEIAGFGSDEAYTNGVDSGAYPKNSFINDRAGYGLIQWTSSGRKAGLYDYSKSIDKSIASLTVQLGHLMNELKSSSYKETYKYITGNYSAYDIANNFCLDFESPRNENTVCPNRAEIKSAEMLNYVENGCN